MTDKRVILKNPQDLADVVSQRRSELRLRLEDVARLADVSRHLVSSIEKGDPGSHLEKLLRILDCLQISTELKREKPRHVETPPEPPKPARTRKTPVISQCEMFTDDGKAICLECGSAVKSMYVHARQQHGLSIAGYRQRWDIPETIKFTPGKAQKDVSK